MELRTRRRLDPFFIDAINLVYQKPRKTAFLMDGTIGVGKSTNFTFEAPYDVAQHVLPKKEAGKKVRRSRWAIVRESENSAVNTLYEIFENNRFPPEVLAREDSPVKKKSQNPTIITISHPLEDGTHLFMSIEAYGIAEEKSLRRFKSRSFLGVMAPELQTMPFSTIPTAIERSGGRSSPGMLVQKEINGQVYTLSGADPLTMIFGDMNIPERPDAVYDEFYDNVNLEQSEYQLITPPSPLLYKPAKQATSAEKSLYPITKFQGEDVIWTPNPDVYFMTRHYEETEIRNGKPVMENGIPKTVPWSGYDYWLKKVAGRDDSYVNRLILGRPDKIGGNAAIYHYDVILDSSTPIKGLPVYVGFDPGVIGGAWVFLQPVRDKIHVFHEIIFDGTDRMDSAEQIDAFVYPYIKENLNPKNIIVVADPYAHSKTAHGEAPAKLLKERLIRVKNCRASNQQTDERVSCLGYFLRTGKITVHPSCEMTILGLKGDYQRKKSAAGIISGKVNKDTKSNHVIEALQYPCVNLYYEMAKKNAKKPKSRISKLVGV